MVTYGEVATNKLDKNLQSLEEAIRRCDERLWRSEDLARTGWGAARQAYHAVESVDFYSRLSPSGFKFFQRLRANWEDDPVEDMPSREDLLAYLTGVRNRAVKHLASITPEAFLAPGGFDGTGPRPWIPRCITYAICSNTSVR